MLQDALVVGNGGGVGDYLYYPAQSVDAAGNQYIVFNRSNGGTFLTMGSPSTVRVERTRANMTGVDGNSDTTIGIAMSGASARFFNGTARR